MGEKKKTNKDKILKKIQDEEKFQKQQRKQVWFNRELTESQREKLDKKIKASMDKVSKLSEKVSKQLKSGLKEVTKLNKMIKSSGTKL